MLGRRAFMVMPLSTGGLSTVIASPAPYYLSDRGWIGAPNDSLVPNKLFAPRIGKPLTIERSLPVTPVGERRGLLQVGSIELQNSDGALDDLARNHPIDGRMVEIKAGRQSGQYASFETLFKGTASNWGSVDDRQIKLILRDSTWEVDQPIQRQLYAGTGGIEGTADLKGKPKPLCFGALSNIPLTLIDPYNLVYQVHDGTLAGIAGVYDRGVALTPLGDVDDITEVTVAAGGFMTQLAGGYVKLGSRPVGLLTADVMGDKIGGAYVYTAADIIFRIIHDRLNIDDGRLNHFAFERMRNRSPGAIGYYVGPEAKSAAEVIDELVAAVGGWWGDNATGQIEVGFLSLPTNQPVARLTTKDILEFELIDLPQEIDPPIWRVTVGYKRNWSPMSNDQIALAVSESDPARLAFLTNEYRFASAAQSVDLKTRYLRAQEIMILTAFDKEEDAAMFAQQVFSMYSEPRRLARVRLKRQGYRLRLGQTISVDYPRHGLAGGKNVVIVGQALDAGSAGSTLDLFW